MLQQEEVAVTFKQLMFVLQQTDLNSVLTLLGAGCWARGLLRSLPTRKIL